MSDFHELKSSLTALSRTELNEIQKTCQLLMERNTELPPDAVALYEAISMVLSINGLEITNIHFFKKIKPGMFNNLCEVSVLLNEWFSGISVKKQIDKRLMYSILSEMVLENIEKSNIPVSTSSMITFFKQAPQYFNNSFPGYSACSAVTFLVASRKSTQKYE